MKTSIVDAINAAQADIDDAKTDLDAYDNAIREEIGDIGWNRITFTSDSFIDLSGITADVTHMSSPGFGFSCAVVQCSVGDKFLLNLTGGGRSRAWGFVAANGNVISVADANTTVSNYTLTAPTNAAYLVVHDSSGRKSYIKGETVAEIIESRGGISDDVKEAMIAFFEEIALFEPTSKAKFETLKELLLGDVPPTWEYLTMNDVFSTVGYTNPNIVDGVFTKDGTEPNFSAVVFRPYVKHVKMTLLLNGSVSSPNPVYRIVDASKVEIMSRYTKRYELTKSNDGTKYSITSTIENTQRNPEFTSTNELKIEDGTLKIINSNDVVVKEIQNSNILGFWSDGGDYIVQATIEKMSASFHLVKANDVLYHKGETSFSVSSGEIHTSDKTFNTVVFKNTVKMFDGRLYSVKNATNAYNTFFVYWTNSDGTVLHATDGTKTFIFTYNSSTGAYDASEATNIGTVTKSTTQGTWSNGRATIWIDNGIFYAMYNNVYITVSSANCIGYWGSDTTGDTYAEGKVM